MESVYNQSMQLRELHSWHFSPSQAQDVRRKLTTLVSKKNYGISPKFIAGLDISVTNHQGIAFGTIVPLVYLQLTVVDVTVSEQRINFLYITGPLSLLELALIINAYQKLSVAPDIILVDGQVIPHPRRLGLASHLVLLVDVLAIFWVMERCRGYRIPEPTRHVHLTANGNLASMGLYSTTMSRSFLN